MKASCKHSKYREMVFGPISTPATDLKVLAIRLTLVQAPIPYAKIRTNSYMPSALRRWLRSNTSFK